MTVQEEHVVRLAYPDVIGAPVHEVDIAEVGVLALHGGHHGKAYHLRGPQCSQRDQVKAIAEAVGHDIRVERVTHSAERAGMVALGVPPWAADHILSYPVRWADEPCDSSPDVELVTGHPPLSFARWAVDHAADFG